jgi:hypothetical protein
VLGASVDTLCSDLRSSRFRARSRFAEFGRIWTYGVGTAGAPKRVKQGFFCDLGGTNPKMTVDLAVLGACQRCNPLPQTYGKSAGMVWGRQDHFFDTQFWSFHARLADAATSGARFCSEPVGARVNAQRSNFRSSRYWARSRCLQSLVTFGCMVLVQLARQNGLNRGIFCDFHF